MSRRPPEDGRDVPVDFRPHVVIFTKRKVYDLGPDAVGQPVEEVFGAAVPPFLRGAKRYMIEDGWVIARLEPDEPPDGGRPS